MTRRKEKPVLPSTTIDAVVVALSPALIIGMVSCLIFFLVVAFYRGQYDQRLIYILFLYTLATVLIARIAIENGRTYAMAFSVPLAIATMVAMLRFVTVSGPLAPIGWLINIVLLGIAWFLSDRITFDCTLLDDREAGVQQGLLQSLGLLRKEGVDPEVSARSRPASPLHQADSGSKQRKLKRKKKHNPGVWVLYFALLAFPLFGFGQLVIPTEEGRDRAFFYLVGYLACALGLLVTTSFVSMRRYLRHRGVAMPADLSRSWLGYGAFGIFVVLVLCMLLPLPGRSLGLVGLPFEFDSPPGLEASRRGWGNEGVENAENQDAAKTTNNAAEAEGNEASPDGQGSPQASDSARSDGPKVASEGGDQGNESRQSSESSSSDRSQSSSESDSPSRNDAQSSESDQQGRESSGDSRSNDERGGEKDPSGSGSETQTDGKQDEGGSERETGEETRNETRNQEANNEQSENADQSTEDQEANPSQNPGDNSRAKPENADEPHEAGDHAEQQQQQNRTASSPQSPSWFSSLPSSLATLVKWLTISLLACVVIFYAITHPREIANMWRDLLKLLSSLFGGKPGQLESQESAPQPTAKSKTIRPFSSYPNPFSESTGWTPDRIIEHTFCALEAWAAERGIARGNEQTAVEFARSLAAKTPNVKNQALGAAKMHDELMFAGWRPNANDVKPLEGLWRAMQSS